MISLRGKTYKHRCSDGSVKIVHRNVDDAFPLALKDLAVKASAEMDALGAEIPGGQTGIEIKEQIAGRLFQLNSLNQSLMASFRAIYTGYQSDPCQHAESYMRAVERTVEEVNRQTLLQTQINGLLALAKNGGTDHKEAMRQFGLICNAGTSDLSAAASDAIDQARREARKWLDAKDPLDENEGNEMPETETGS